MILNKKYFLAILTALGMQTVLGINLASAVPCEDIINTQVEENKQNHIKWGWKYEHSVAGFDNVQSFYFTSVNDFWPKLKAYLPDRGYENGKRIPKDAHFIKHWRDLERLKIEGYKLEKCYTQALLDANGDIDAIINGSSTNNSSSNKASSSGTSRQANTSNATSNQSSAAAQSNSPESYNLQVSQTNKQNYQAVQRAYEQANAGKGKKHNKEANATECMKNNPAHISFTNKCNQAINFTYCFSGVPTGAKNENPQTLADLSCQNAQFGTLTIGAGESIPGSYNGLSIQGLPCKSPSQAVDMTFDRSTNAATGRCSF